MERRKKTRLDLPAGISPADLRFVHPMLYRISMTPKGWDTTIEEGIGGNPARVSYSLLRTVPIGLDIQNLKARLGIVDTEGNNLPGYYLDTTENPEASRTLLFNFTGFPTEKTIDALFGLEREFMPEETAQTAVIEIPLSRNGHSNTKNLFQRARRRFGLV